MDGTVGHSAPLKVFWWKGVPNFGDALSARVVEHVSGRPVIHAGPVGCDLLAIGSLVQVMRRRLRSRRADGSRPVIWGAGLLHAVPVDFLDNVEVALLRGPTTAALLGVKTSKFGDPGLLADRVYGLPVDQQDRVALIPHHTQIEDPAIVQLANNEPAIDLIDPRADVDEVCRRIASARHVIASSLHGLVVADAFGVPSTWLDPGAQSHLKYHDYAAGIGRSMRAPVAMDDIAAVLSSLKDNDGLAHADGIAAARAALDETFPAQLRAVPDTVSTPAVEHSI